MVYKTVVLTDGRNAELDWLREDQLPEVVETLNSVIREGKYLFINSEMTDLEEERRWFEHGTKEGMRYLVARLDGKVVGGAGIHPHTEKSTHVADYGIYIREDCRNLGLGTALTRELIEIAKKQRLEILQLSVYATNNRALHVYKKCGFKKCGRLTRDVKFLDGTYADKILMELLLHGNQQQKMRRNITIRPIFKSSRFHHKRALAADLPSLKACRTFQDTGAPKQIKTCVLTKMR